MLHHAHQVSPQAALPDAPIEKTYVMHAEWAMDVPLALPLAAAPVVLLAQHVVQRVSHARQERGVSRRSVQRVFWGI